MSADIDAFIQQQKAKLVAERNNLGAGAPEKPSPREQVSVHVQRTLYSHRHYYSLE